MSGELRIRCLSERERSSATVFPGESRKPPQAGTMRGRTSVAVDRKLCLVFNLLRDYLRASIAVQPPGYANLFRSSAGKAEPPEKTSSSLSKSPALWPRLLGA